MNWIWLFAGLLVLTAVVYYFVRPARPSGTAERDELALLLRAEQLQLSKTREMLADVTTRKEILRELKTVTVPVTREELVVERNGAEMARIPIREEQVDVSTRSVLLNDVSVYQRKWEEEKEIQAVLKKEVARVEATGGAEYTQEGP